MTPPLPFVRYKAGDSDAQEWGKSSFFYAAPSSNQTDETAHSGHVMSSEEHTAIRAGAAAAAAAAASARTRRVKRRVSGLTEVTSARPGLDVQGLEGTWGPDAVKVAVFGDMGTAEVDGTLDAGHSNEPPSLGTVGILTDHLRGVKVRAGAVSTTVAGDGDEDRGALEGEVGRGAEPQLGLVLHIGDLSYARGYDAQWDEVSKLALASCQMRCIQLVYYLYYIIASRPSYKKMNRNMPRTVGRGIYRQREPTRLPDYYQSQAISGYLERRPVLFTIQHHLVCYFGI